MPTVERLIELVTRKVDDESYDDLIIDFLSDGMLDIASRILLPLLEETDTVTTVLDINVAAMPGDYHRNLFSASPVDENKPGVRVLNSKAQLNRKYDRLDNVGDVRHICMSAGTLLYQPIPTLAQEINISYYRIPVDVDDADDDTIAPLPANYHKMLVDYACAQIYSEIEDGMEGQKVNTRYHEGRYEKFMIELETHLADAQSLPDPPVIRGCFL